MRMRTSLGFLASSLAATVAACSAGPDTTGTVSSAEEVVAPSAHADGGQPSGGGDSKTRSRRSSTWSSSSARTARSITSSRRTSPSTASASTTSSRRRSSTRTARPGPNFELALQKLGGRLAAEQVRPEPRTKKPYAILPPVARRRPEDAVRLRRVADAEAAENGLPRRLHRVPDDGRHRSRERRRRHPYPERRPCCRRARSS